MNPKTTPKPDYSQWLTKQQAAEAIGCSTKTVEQLARDRQIQSVKWRRPEGGPRIAVYHPSDVESLRKKRNPASQAFVVPAKEAKETTALVLPEPAPILAQLGGRIIETLTSQTSQKVRVSERLFLSLREAAEYSGLPKTEILRLIQAKQLAGSKTGLGWRIPRAALEHYAYLCSSSEAEPAQRAAALPTVPLPNPWPGIEHGV